MYPKTNTEIYGAGVQALGNADGVLNYLTQAFADEALSCQARPIRCVRRL